MCYRQCSYILENTTAKINHSEVLSIAQMRSKLDEMNCDIPASAAAQEVEDLYDHTMALRIIYKRHLIADKVPFPTTPTSAHYNDSLKKFLSFNFTDGASFVQDRDNLSDQHIISLIRLLSAFLEYKNIKYTDFDSPIYKVLPSIIVEFANKSRFDSGYRLLERCP